MIASNDNRTKIYRIRRKSDGKFLIQAPYYPEEYFGKRFEWRFNSCGVFWKKDETVRKHLIRLCRFVVYNGHGEDRIRLYDSVEFSYYPQGMPIKLVGMHYERLDLYEVVATDITVHGEDTMSAREFASFTNDLRKAA